MEREDFDNLGLIAARKYEFLKFTEELIEKEKELEKDEKQKLKQIIGEMSNERFLSEDEVEKGKLSETTNLEDYRVDVKTLLENTGFEGLVEKYQDESSDSSR